jgi:hypothetical protein
VVHRFLHAVFHGGIDVRIAVLPARVLYEEREGRAPVVLTKRERGQCLSIGHALKTSVATMRSFEMITRVLAAEGDLKSGVCFHPYGC